LSVYRYKGFPRASVIKYKIGQEPPAIVNRSAIKNEVPPQAFKKEKLAQSKSEGNENIKQKPICKPEVTSFVHCLIHIMHSLLAA